jgi:DNA-binding MarR family transcriptional regulator
MSERKATVIGATEKAKGSAMIFIEHEFALKFDINETKLRLLELLVREAKGSRLKGSMVYLDHAALMEKLGVTRTSIFNYIRSLESVGLLKKVKPRQEVYEINVDLMRVCTIRDATAKPKSVRGT